MRSAITVAGIVGTACSSSRIRGSTSSTTDPRGGRSYFGGPSLRNAAFTVFFETPMTRAITLIGIRSDRCNRRISAQSSTASTRSLPGSARARVSGGGQLCAAARGSVFRRRRHILEESAMVEDWTGWRSSHPMLDPRFITASYGLDPGFAVKDGHDRAVQRDAFRDRL